MRAVKVVLVLLAGALAGLGVAAPVGLADRPAAQKASAPAKRVPWTTSKVKGSPEPPPPYRLEVVFPKLKFFEPLEATAAAGTDRMFVATRPGKIFSFVPDAKTAEGDLLIDIKKTVYGLTFHPKFDK